MKSAWATSDAEAAVARYARDGIARDLALRVYTTRLLGQNPKLVLHGGGNTSVKTRMTDLNGEEVDVLCVKGSGWDMGTIEPAGLPAVRLEPLKKLRRRNALSDEDMVRVQRANLLDPSAPNPSVETLLHAFLPHAFVDHTHSTAVLSLTDQPEGEKLCEEVYGKRLGYVPYIMPGFALAKAAADAFERDRSVEGLILHKHGIFTFGADAREAYERMIEHVTLAEERLKRGRKTLAMAKLPAQIARPRRGRADHPRRLRAEGRQDRGRVDAHDPRLPCERCDPEFRQRRGACTLFAGRRGDARPHHPHQELAADRARAGSRQARRIFRATCARR